jgi:hypothetical protein
MSLPAVAAVIPGIGVVPTPVLILGSNFHNVQTVRFGSHPATVIIADPVLGIFLLVVPPPGTGTVDVTVTTSEGTSQITPADRYVYLWPPPPPPARPTVTGVTPNHGPVIGGQLVTVTGTGFTPGNTHVLFG